MKKITTLMVTIFVAITMNAQHVTPLEITMVEMHLDSLRATYGDDLDAYMVQLQHISLDIDGNAEAIKNANKQLNEEKDYAKCIADYIKYANKLLKTYEKNCKEEIDDLKNIEKTIDKQTNKARGLKLVTHSSKPKFIEHMDKERQQVVKEQSFLKNKLQMLGKQQAQIEAIQSGLDIFNAEIVNKSNELKRKETILKANQDALKQEMKAVKAGMKAAK